MKQFSRFCFKVHCSAVHCKEFSKSLCKKWETASESSPHIHCKVKNEEGNSLFYPPLFSSDDEHLLIQHYCQSLNQESPLSQPRSPAQILISLESEERGELERILADLEEENRWVMPPPAAALGCTLQGQTKAFSLLSDEADIVSPLAHSHFQCSDESALFLSQNLLNGNLQRHVWVT